MAHVLSLLRLCLAPLFALAALRGRGELAAGLLAFAIASDLLDGPLARRRGKTTPVGRALDHGADFTFVEFGLAAGFARGLVPLPLPLLVAVAFTQYVVDSLWLHRVRQLRMSTLGRWNGVLYFVPLGGIALVDLGAAFLTPAILVLGWLLVLSTALSIIDRLLAVRRDARR